MKKYVITGATGFIGSNLIKKILSEKCGIVYGIGRDIEKLKSFNSELFIPVICDFDNYDKLSTLINDDIDYFVHLAWGGALQMQRKIIHYN